MRRLLRDILGLLAIGCAGSFAARAGAAGALPGSGEGLADPRPAVLELFTSQGCSSCPPADAYIGELAGRRGVLALTFHVDYWDELGWRDPFALTESVRRQRGYARRLGHPGVFTPEAVVDGAADFVGSDRESIERTLTGARQGVGLALARQGDEVQVALSPWRSGGLNEVLLIAYRRTAVSAVQRGENAGRTLTEYNIVREIRNLGRWDGDRRQFHVAAASLPPDATDVAVLVQREGQGPIIGAAYLTIADRPVAMPLR